MGSIATTACNRHITYGSMRPLSYLTGMSSLAWPDDTRFRLCRNASLSFWDPWYLTKYRAGQNFSSSLAQLSSTELGTTTRCGRLSFFCHVRIVLILGEMVGGCEKRKLLSTREGGHIKRSRVGLNFVAQEASLQEGGDPLEMGA